MLATEVKGRNSSVSSVSYLSLKKSISPRRVVIASNVSRGSQVVGELGPVGWIGLLEGPGGKSKSLSLTQWTSDTS